MFIFEEMRCITLFFSWLGSVNLIFFFCYRYVDTFNHASPSSAKSFHSPSVPSVKPAIAANAKFFVPSPVVTAEQPMEAIAENAQENTGANGIPSTAAVKNSYLSPRSAMNYQRFPSMDNIPSPAVAANSDSSLPHSRRTASWSGSFNDPSYPNMPESFGGPPPPRFMASPARSGSIGDDLQEVEL